MQARLVGFCHSLTEYEHEDAAVGVKAAAGGRARLGEGSAGSRVGSRGHQAGTGESRIHVLALAIDRRVDLMRDAVVSLVALETNVVRGGDAPKWTTFYLVG